MTAPLVHTSKSCSPPTPESPHWTTRALKERTVERLGSNRPIKVGFRLVAAGAP